MITRLERLEDHMVMSVSRRRVCPIPYYHLLLPVSRSIDHGILVHGQAARKNPPGILGPDGTRHPEITAV